MYNFLQSKGITSVYHFTEKSNLKSIQDYGGIYSLAKLKEKEISEVSYISNEWSQNADNYKDLDTYVHLCFIQGEHPMASIAAVEKQKDIIWLEIAAEILKLPGVLYTNDVSNKAGVQTYNSTLAKSKLDINAIYDFLDFEDGIELNYKDKKLYLLEKINLESRVNFYSSAYGSEFLEFYKLNKKEMLNLFGNFLIHISDEKHKEFENKYEIAGPFGTLWGIKKEEFEYVGKIEKYKKDNFLRAYLELKELYNIDDTVYDFFEMYEFTPQQKSDKLEKYMAVFDKDNGLIQVLCVAFSESSQTAAKEDCVNQKNKAKERFVTLQKILDNQYKKPSVKKDDYEVWKSDKNVNVELLKRFENFEGLAYSSYLKAYYNCDYTRDYVYLIYSSPTLEQELPKIQNYKIQKEKADKEAREAKEKKENSFF